MTFIGTVSLNRILSNSQIISPFDANRIKNGAYELSLGAQVFQTDSSPRAIKKLENGDKIEIKPGQFALLLTNEYLKMPMDKLAFISIKATIKFKGLINVSGFHVDPGFEGKLLFSVYNAGSYNIVLASGAPYFPIWFSELDSEQDYEGTHDKQTQIPDGPVEALIQGELASPNVLSKKIDDNHKEIERRFELIEKEQTAEDYLLKTAVGLGIILVVKFCLDWGYYKNGFEAGLDAKKQEINLQSSINNLISQQKALMIQIDSLNKLNTSLQSIKKQSRQ